LAVNTTLPAFAAFRHPAVPLLLSVLAPAIDQYFMPAGHSAVGWLE